MSDIRERHWEAASQTTGKGKGVCQGCKKPWPCDAIQEADRADALLVRAQELSARLDEAGAYRVDAEADADRLAEALRGLRVPHPPGSYDHAIAWDASLEALRQHEAPTDE